MRPAPRKYKGVLLRDGPAAGDATRILSLVRDHGVTLPVNLPAVDVCAAYLQRVPVLHAVPAISLSRVQSTSFIGLVSEVQRVMGNGVFKLRPEGATD